MNKILTVGAIATTAAISALGWQTSTWAANFTLGEQDFTNGTLLANLNDFEAAAIGEPEPFDAFKGNDAGVNFSETWTFSYGALSNITAASLSLGIFDHDSQAAGSQVSAFSIDGIDLTSLLDAAFESFGGAQLEYNVYTIALPVSILSALADGIATVSLTLKEPGLQGNSNSSSPTPGNGAGLDFSTLSITSQSTTIPEPSYSPALLAVGGIAMSLALKKGRSI
jgi:hypothetical protein